MNNQLMYYYQVNLICFILLAIMFVTMNNKKGVMQARQITFNTIIIITAIMCASDILCWQINGVTFRGAVSLNYISNMLYYASLTVTSYTWLIYVNVRIRSADYNHRKLMVRYSVPLIIMLLIIVTTPETGWLFTVDEVTNIYSRANGVYIHWIISYGYLFLATAQVIIAIHKAETRTRKQELRSMLVFILWPVLTAVMQMFFFGLTVTQCGITLSIITITMQNLQSEITTDELTKLNNRAAFDKYIYERIDYKGQDFSVLMCDIDKFKTINDTMGHSVGDQALKAVSRVLREACDAVNSEAFLCRYGGDEFVLCAQGDSGKFDALTEYVNRRLLEIDDMPGGLIRLSMSFGVANGPCGASQEFEALLKEADDAMYVQKQAKKATR